MLFKETGLSPLVIGQIRDIAMECGVEKVILYGSRARGDYHKKSDIDLAVTGGDTVSFAADVDEKTDTLLRYDIVDLGRTLQESFLNEIEKDGIVIYEKV